MKKRKDMTIKETNRIDKLPIKDRQKIQILCGCGCGGTTTYSDAYGRNRYCIQGHNKGRTRKVFPAKTKAVAKKITNNDKLLPTELLKFTENMTDNEKIGFATALCAGIPVNFRGTDMSECRPLRHDIELAVLQSKRAEKTGVEVLSYLTSSWKGLKGGAGGNRGNLLDFAVFGLSPEKQAAHLVCLFYDRTHSIFWEHFGKTVKCVAKLLKTYTFSSIWQAVVRRSLELNGLGRVPRYVESPYTFFKPSGLFCLSHDPAVGAIEHMTLLNLIDTIQTSLDMSSDGHTITIDCSTGGFMRKHRADKRVAVKGYYKPGPEMSEIVNIDDEDFQKGEKP